MFPKAEQRESLLPVWGGSGPWQQEERGEMVQEGFWGCPCALIHPFWPVGGEWGAPRAEEPRARPIGKKAQKRPQQPGRAKPVTCEFRGFAVVPWLGKSKSVASLSLVPITQ